MHPYTIKQYIKQLTPLIPGAPLHCCFHMNKTRLGLRGWSRYQLTLDEQGGQNLTGLPVHHRVNAYRHTTIHAHINTYRQLRGTSSLELCVVRLGGRKPTQPWVQHVGQRTEPSHCEELLLTTAPLCHDRSVTEVIYQEKIPSIMQVCKMYCTTFTDSIPLVLDSQTKD